MRTRAEARRARVQKRLEGLERRKAVWAKRLEDARDADSRLLAQDHLSLIETQITAVQPLAIDDG